MYHDGYGGYYYGDKFGNDLGTPNNQYGQNNPLNPNNKNPSTGTGPNNIGGSNNKPGGFLGGLFPSLPTYGSSGSGLLPISNPSIPGSGTSAPPTTPEAGTPVTDP
jgi:hypothetical protein